ncbi:MAG: hypothetical protein RLY43_945, partial [Bacteroidota bacterium]
YFGYNDFSGINIDATMINIRKPYILFVGDRGGYKNFNNLVLAYSKSKFLKNNFSLVVFGGGEFNSDELNLLNDNKLVINDNVHIYNGTDESLAFLYKNALCMVYPSMYEGFGLPLLEAMSMGCPVVASNTSCIPEIVGNAAYLFNPYSLDDIEDSLNKVIDGEFLRAQLISNGYIRLENFSWEKCGRETFQCYKKINK